MGCPFFLESKKLSVSCEGGTVIKMKDKEVFNDYVMNLCKSDTGWRECNIAVALEMIQEKTYPPEYNANID